MVDNLLDFNLKYDICRLCLSRDSELLPIFSTSNDIKNYELPSLIMSFTSIKVEKGDGLPGKICNSCLFNVERVFEFKQLCEQSDATLRKCYVKNENSTVVEELTHKNRLNKDTQLPDSKQHFSHSKIIENCDGVINSPLKSLAVEGVEPIVMVVDPNARTLDADDFDNNDTQMDDLVQTELRVSPTLEFDYEFSSQYYRSKDRLDHLRRNSPVKIVDTGKTFVLYHCNSCNKPFSDRNAFERHLEIHNQEPYFPCDFCEMFFEDRASLKSHWHSHAPSGYLVCMICGEAYKDVSELFQHTKLHELFQSYSCYVCNKVFTFECELRKHIQTHDGASPYYCNICKKTFARSANLRKHEKSHIGARPFGCDECLKRFTTRADLTRHMLTHSGIKPFSCNVCGLAFSRRDKMVRHNKLHERLDRRLFCEKCMLSFSNRKVLASHYEIHHPKLEVPDGMKCVLKSNSKTVNNKSFDIKKSSLIKTENVDNSTSILETELKKDNSSSEGINSIFSNNSSVNSVIYERDPEGESSSNIEKKIT